MDQCPTSSESTIAAAPGTSSSPGPLKPADGPEPQVEKLVNDVKTRAEKKAEKRRLRRQRQKERKRLAKAAESDSDGWEEYDSDDSDDDLTFDPSKYRIQRCYMCWGCHPCTLGGEPIQRFCYGDYDWFEEAPSVEAAMVRAKYGFFAGFKGKDNPCNIS